MHARCGVGLTAPRLARDTGNNATQEGIGRRLTHHLRCWLSRRETEVYGKTG
jgi:hypothetical protein